MTHSFGGSCFVIILLILKKVENLMHEERNDVKYCLKNVHICKIKECPYIKLTFNSHLREIKNNELHKPNLKEIKLMSCTNQT